MTTALSYIPANSPFVISSATTSNPGGQALVNRLPTLALAETALFAKLRQLGIDHNNDIRALFGNPLVGGLVLKSGPGTSEQFVAAWVTKDASKLSALIKKLAPAVRQAARATARRCTRSARWRSRSTARPRCSALRSRR